MVKTTFAAAGSVPIQILLAGFLFGQLSFCQNSPPLQSGLFQKIQKLQNLIPKHGNNWATNKNQYIFSSNVLTEDLVPSFLKNLFESFEEFELFATTELFAGVSDQCKDHSLQIFSQLIQAVLSSSKKKSPDTWVLQMVDAWGKFPAGILSGHTASPGDFHECLQIRGKHTNEISKETSNFKGRYCSTFLLPGDKLQNLMYGGKKTTGSWNKYDAGYADLKRRDSVDPDQLVANSVGANGVGTNLFPFIGTCFPSSCSTEDARAIFTTFYKYTTKGYLDQVVVDCYTDEKPPFDAGDIVVICILSVIGLLCLIGSLVDILWYKKRTNSNTVSFGIKLLMSFSVPSNTQKLLSTNVGSGDLGCLHGLRFLSIAWVVLGHTWLMASYTFTWNLIDLQNIQHSWSSLAIINGTVSVDTFFVMSGALMGYNLLKELKRNNGKFNYPLMILHRYLRITPTYIILVAIMGTIMPYIASGPQWYIMESGSTPCAKYWWHNALYINNLVDMKNICYGESWYLSNDMQFFVFAPLIIYPLWKWKKIGFGILGLFSIASIITPAVIQREYKLPPTSIPFINSSLEYTEYLYMKPWSRMGPYLVGIFLGYILYLKSTNPATFRKLPLWAVIIGWTISTGTALAIVFGIPDMFDSANEHETLTSLRSAFYAGLNRFVWGIVIAWIIFACVSGYGGWVNKFLSWKIFMPLGRLTFCIYISSFHLQQFYHLTQTHPVDFSAYAYVNLYFAHMVMACLVGYILTMTLESPFIQLEKLLFQPMKSSPKPKEELPTIIKNDDNNNQ